MDDLAQWLEQLGLARYARLFAENDIDLDALPHLTDDELKELGVTLGHRAKLRAALGARAETHPSVEPGSPRARETRFQPADAERRQVSVMFCDLVASTALSTQLEAEDYRISSERIRTPAPALSRASMGSWQSSWAMGC